MTRVQCHPLLQLTNTTREKRGRREMVKTKNNLKITTMVITLSTTKTHVHL